MPSSIFGQQPAGNSVLSAVSAFKGAVGGNPQAAFDHMYQTNPQFRQFADSMRGKTPQQAFQENGLDFTQIRGLL